MTDMGTGSGIIVGQTVADVMSVPLDRVLAKLSGSNVPKHPAAVVRMRPRAPPSAATEPPPPSGLPTRMARDDPKQSADVAVIVTRVLAKDREDLFRDWSDRVGDDARRAPGHCGGLRLEQTGGLFHTLQRFASRGDLEAWQRSDGYRRLMREGDRFSTPRTQEVEGDHPVARLPSDGDGPKWKLFLMSWLGVLPLVLLFNGAFELLELRPPWYVRATVQSCFLVALMTCVVRPALARRLKPWAMRDGDGGARVTRDD